MDSFFSLFDPGSCSDCSNNQEFALDNMNNQTALPPEPQLGNVEYKLKIVNPTKQRFEHLVTQVSHYFQLYIFGSLKHHFSFIHSSFIIIYKSPSVNKNIRLGLFLLLN